MAGRRCRCRQSWCSPSSGCRLCRPRIEYTGWLHHSRHRSRRRSARVDATYFPAGLKIEDADVRTKVGWECTSAIVLSRAAITLGFVQTLENGGDSFVCCEDTGGIGERHAFRSFWRALIQVPAAYPRSPPSTASPPPCTSRAGQQRQRRVERTRRQRAQQGGSVSRESLWRTARVRWRGDGTFSRSLAKCP